MEVLRPRDSHVWELLLNLSHIVFSSQQVLPVDSKRSCAGGLGISSLAVPSSQAVRTVAISHNTAELKTPTRHAVVGTNVTSMFELEPWSLAKLHS